VKGEGMGILGGEEGGEGRGRRAGGVGGSGCI